MASKEYEYTREWNGHEIDYWPKVPARVRIGEKFIDFDGGIIDSGAQHCLVHIDSAPILGVELRACLPVPMGGAGGENAIGYASHATITMSDFGYAFETPII